MKVFFENRVVGRIEIDSQGPSFTYEPSWLSTAGAFPISITMPLASNTVDAETFLPWAANLLPEGGALRRIGELIRASPEDVISILSEIGRDTAGALSIDRPGASQEEIKAIKTQKDLAKIINDLPKKPFLAGEDGVSMSLAGVQTKLGVRHLENGQIAIPLNGSASTHILKPDSDSLVGSVQNEAYCLTLANLCKLATSDVTTGVAAERRYLLLKRYDRIFMNNRWRRLHQEDFCQALGKPPEAKYERNQTGIKGPTALDMLLLARRAAGGSGVIALLDYIVFNIAVCNTDAHAKNYSILITSRGFQIAPIYDVVCTQVWDGVTLNLAQSIAGQTRGDHINRHNWEELAERAGLNAASTIKRVENMLNTMESKLSQARNLVANMPAGDHIILESVQKAIKNRITRLRTGLATSTPSISRQDGEGSPPTPRRAHVSALRKAHSPKEFRKAVRNLEKDKSLKAHDVRTIALEVLGRKFSSKKAALEALSLAESADLRLLS